MAIVGFVRNLRTKEETVFVLVAQRRTRGGKEFEAYSAGDDCQKAQRNIYHACLIAKGVPSGS